MFFTYSFVYLSLILIYVRSQLSCQSLSVVCVGPSHSFSSLQAAIDTIIPSDRNKNTIWIDTNEINLVTGEGDRGIVIVNKKRGTVDEPIIITPHPELVGNVVFKNSGTQHAAVFIGMETEGWRLLGTEKSKFVFELRDSDPSFEDSDGAIWIATGNIVVENIILDYDVSNGEDSRDELIEVQCGTDCRSGSFVNVSNVEAYAAPGSKDFYLIQFMITNALSAEMIYSFSGLSFSSPEGCHSGIHIDVGNFACENCYFLDSNFTNCKSAIFQVALPSQGFFAPNAKLVFRRNIFAYHDKAIEFDGGMNSQVIIEECEFIDNNFALYFEAHHVVFRNNKVLFEETITGHDGCICFSPEDDYILTADRTLTIQNNEFVIKSAESDLWYGFVNIKKEYTGTIIITNNIFEKIVSPIESLYYAPIMVVMLCNSNQNIRGSIQNNILRCTEFPETGVPEPSFVSTRNSTGIGFSIIPFSDFKIYNNLVLGCVGTRPMFSHDYYPDDYQEYASSTQMFCTSGCEIKSNFFEHPMMFFDDIFSSNSVGFEIFKNEYYVDMVMDASGRILQKDLSGWRFPISPKQDTNGIDRKVFGDFITPGPYELKECGESGYYSELNSVNCTCQNHFYGVDCASYCETSVSDRMELDVTTNKCVCKFPHLTVNSNCTKCIDEVRFVKSEIESKGCVCSPRFSGVDCNNCSHPHMDRSTSCLECYPGRIPFGSKCARTQTVVGILAGIIASVLVVLCLVVISVILITVCVVCVKKRKNSPNKLKEIGEEELITKPPPKPPALRIKKSLFEIKKKQLKMIEEIGSGGSGTIIYKAKWNNIVVAYKVFRTSNLIGETVDESVVQEFEREIEVMGSISHPNSKNFTEPTFDNQLVVSTGRNCDGILVRPLFYKSKGISSEKGDLREFLLRNDFKFSEKEKLEILLGVARGMTYLHERQILHRDLKPENILIAKDRTPKIIDFGLSRIIEQGSEHAQKTQRIGTMFYMSPEIMMGSSYDNKVDVFSFAIISYNVFFNSFSPYSKSAKDVVGHVDFQVANSGLRPEIPQSCDVSDWICQLMKNMWKQDPQERPSFRDIVEIIEEKSC